MKYYRSHLRELMNEAVHRHNALMLAMDPGAGPVNDGVHVNGTAIRLAADDYKTILTEIRRLK